MNSENGRWITEHEKVLESWVWSLPGHQYKFWRFLLFKANWKDGWFEGRRIKRGQLATSTHNLAEDFEFASRRTLCRWLDQFVEQGMISKEGTSKYTIITILNYRQYQDIPKDGTADGTAGGTASAPLVTHNSTKKPRNQETNTPLNPPRGKFDPLAIQIPDSLNASTFVDAWSEWIAYKSQIKKPYKAESGVKSLLTRLAGWGPNRAAEAIRYSMAQGWTGIHEESQPANGKTVKRSLPSHTMAPDRKETHDRT